MVTRLTACVYVAASESQIMYVVIVLFSDEIIDNAGSFMEIATRPSLKWAHDNEPRIPGFVSHDDAEGIQSRYPFWLCINHAVTRSGPYRPIRLFRHSSQTLYSKTRGGVDGSSQARATLRCASNALKWEQKVVSHVLKTLSVNAFVAWRMLMKEDMLNERESFRGLQQYRRALNDLQSQADYVHDVVLELLEYSEKFTQEEMEQDETAKVKKVSERELLRLCKRARARKRNRLVFFNSGDGLRLRISVKNHPHCQGEVDIYCALCGQNRDAAFRGHRTRIKCGYCHVQLCLKVHEGFRKSCWDVWHSAKRLAPRSPIGKTPDKSDSEEEDEIERGIDERAWKKRRRSQQKASTSSAGRS